MPSAGTLRVFKLGTNSQNGNISIWIITALPGHGRHIVVGTHMACWSHTLDNLRFWTQPSDRGL